MEHESAAQLRGFATRYTAWCSQDAAGVAAFFSPSGSLAINDDAPAVGRVAESLGHFDSAEHRRQLEQGAV